VRDRERGKVRESVRGWGESKTEERKAHTRKPTTETCSALIRRHWGAQLLYLSEEMKKKGVKDKKKKKRTGTLQTYQEGFIILAWGKCICSSLKKKAPVLAYLACRSTQPTGIAITTESSFWWLAFFNISW